MLRILAVILLVLWFVGLISGKTTGSFIHILLVISLILFFVNFTNDRRSL